MRYAIIPAKYVDHNTQVAAHRALAFARKDLRLPDIQIKWFVHDYQAKGFPEAEYFDTAEYFGDNRPILGMYDPHEPTQIQIMAMQLDENIQKAVLHEVFHVNQRFKGSCVGHKEAFEVFASPYAEDALKRMKAMPSHDLDEIFLDHMAGKDWSDAARETEAKPSVRNGSEGRSTPRNVHKTYYG